MRLPSLIRLVVLVVIGAVPVAGQVQAQRLNIDAFLQQWDTDHDGTLSVDEIKKAALARFEELDRNHKGRLSRNQLAGVLAFQQFRQADKGKDGTLNKDEFLSVVEKLFQAADKDHDGTLDKTELGSSSGRTLLKIFAVRQGPIM
jgi:Ca2+-binding EF-hand superfamily protein